MGKGQQEPGFLMIKTRNKGRKGESNEARNGGKYLLDGETNFVLQNELKL